MNQNPKTWAKAQTNDELRRNLITTDFQGKAIKEAALNELVVRSVDLTVSSLNKVDEPKGPVKAMTATDLTHKVVRLLANNGWTRYWLNWPSAEDKPWLMAVASLDDIPDSNGRLRTVPIHGLKERGFTEVIETYGPVYIIERIADDGTPFRNYMNKFDIKY